MEISWISHACFKITSENGKILYTDPYKIPKDEQKADFVIISHSHYDHMDHKSINNIIKEGTIVLGPLSISKELKKYNGKGLEFGQEYEFEDIKIKPVRAYTIEKNTHPKENNWMGYIITSDGIKIYHAGDTELIPEMRELQSENIKVALLPCGGTYTMNFQEAISAALEINPEIIVPMHNWDKNLNEFKELLNQRSPSIKVEILKDKNLKI
jgi:L-ascorbate metabolism protein UlaG (beta-lactamase superfamily)